MNSNKALTVAVVETKTAYGAKTFLKATLITKNAWLI